MAATTLASAVVDAVLLRLAENPAASKHWSRDEVRDLVWEGLVETTLITGHLQVDVSVTLSGNSMQALPNHIALLHVQSGNKSLQKYSLDQLDFAKPLWDGEAIGFIPAIWAPIGATQMVTAPRTTASVVCTMLQLPAVPSETDILPLDDEYIGGLVEYAFCVSRMKEGGAEFQQSLKDYDRYLQRIAQLSERVQWKSTPQWVQTPKTLLAMAVPRAIGSPVK